MKNSFLIIFLAIASLTVNAQKLGPNTSFFSASDYYVPNSNGDYEEYSVYGFYESSAATVTKKIVILPSIALRDDDIELLDSEANITSSVNEVKFLNIKPSYLAEMPDKYQAIGIMASIKGLKRYSATLPLIKNGFSPAIYPPATSNMDIVSFVNNTYTKHDSVLKAQDKLLADWNDPSKYLPELATTDGFNISIIANGAVVATQSYSGTSIFPNNKLPIITVINPSVATVNTIKRGSYNLMIDYWIKDSKLSAISASIDIEKTIQYYVKETQQIITTEKSRGLTIFGIGYRKNSITQSVDHQLTEQLKDTQDTKVRIVSDNASDEMFSEFLQLFFPTATLNEVIYNHEKAALDAEAQGDNALAKVHRDYIDALRSQDPKNDINPLAAAAALSSGNYAAFIASGVRANWGDGGMTNNFIKVISRNFSEDIKNKYSMAKHYSVARLCNISITPTGEKEFNPYVGWTMMYPYSFRINQFNSISGLVVGGVQEGSPLHAAGVLPGMLITSINGKKCNTPNVVINILRNTSPGDILQLQVYSGYGYITYFNVETKIGDRR